MRVRSARPTPTLLRRSVAELIGTFLLVLVGPGAVMLNVASGGRIGHLGVSLAFGLVVALVIFAFGRLSGAHINPAVTVALVSMRRFPRSEVLAYVAAQCAGAVAASILLAQLLGAVGNSGATLPAVGIARAFGVEWLLSALLMTVIAVIATSGVATRMVPALAIGLTVGLCAFMGGPLTGASMNPARSLGPALIGGHWEAHWLYWLAPMSAMLVTSRFFAATPKGKSP